MALHNTPRVMPSTISHKHLIQARLAATFEIDKLFFLSRKAMGAFKKNLTAIVITLLVLLLLSFIPYTNLPPHNSNNACAIFKQYPRWYWDTLHVQEQYGIPISVQLAIIKQESNFHAAALTRHHHLLGITLPWTHISSAKGYAQILDSTWEEYKKSTHHYYANRDSFNTAVHFIGWYAQRISVETGISNNNARDLYLAYHEGIKGYNQVSYQSKPWLIKRADQVQKQALRYELQLASCKNSLPKRTWYRYW